ncbi:uncharacterized protein [Argopecten irradians]|uniref:uncharacterized protein n=1 Tax=Argopecten irradians TaxID=31199 RepID=UPI00371DAB5A
MMHAAISQKRKLQLKQQRKLPSSKLRRLQLNESLEGDTYPSSLEENVDIEHIPEAVPKGKFKKLDPNGRHLTNITFDLETTGLIEGHTMPQITQIAARVVDTGDVYNTYVIPTIPIGEVASKLTGISINSSGELIANGYKKDALSIADGLQNFCDFLEKYQNPVLIAHYGLRFDFPVIVNAAKNVNKLDQLLSCTFGCIDSIRVFREAFPGQLNYKQINLAKSLLGEDYSYGAHDACEDVKALSDLLRKKEVTRNILLAHSFSFLDVCRALMFKHEKSKNIHSLKVLVSNGIFKLPTVENVAGSGLTLQHLITIYKRNGEDGLRSTFTQKNVADQPRVTRSNKVLDESLPKLVEFIEMSLSSTV